MPLGIRAITRIQDADDIVALTASEDGEALIWDNGSLQFSTSAFEVAGAVATHAAVSSTHGVSGNIVGTSSTQTLTNKTLTLPIISDLTNATHTHEDAANGGKLDHGSALTGLTDDDHTQYILATGNRIGASSVAQQFTNGITAPSVKAITDSTSAIELQNSAGNGVVIVDTVNSYLGINGIPADALSIYQVDDTGGLRVYGYDDKSSDYFKMTVTSSGTGAFNTTSNMLFTCAGTSLQFKANNASGTIRFVNQSNSRIVTLNQSRNMGIQTSSPTAALDLPASTTSFASLRIRDGVSPTSPNDGDIWQDGSDLLVRINGTSYILNKTAV